jgi:hypothetical protein
MRLLAVQWRLSIECIFPDEGAVRSSVLASIKSVVISEKSRPHFEIH